MNEAEEAFHGNVLPFYTQFLFRIDTGTCFGKIEAGLRNETHGYDANIFEHKCASAELI